MMRTQFLNLQLKPDRREIFIEKISLLAPSIQHQFDQWQVLKENDLLNFWRQQLVVREFVLNGRGCPSARREETNLMTGPNGSTWDLERDVT